MTSFTYIVIVSAVLSLSLAADKLDYYNLHNDIFSIYNSEVRPVSSDDEILQIVTDFVLVSISELREKDQTLVTFGYMRMSWQDDFLSWNTSAYGDVYDMVVPQSKVWLPDIVVGNSVEKMVKLGFDEVPVRLYATGDIEWVPSIIFETSCDVDIRYYPFDTQVCKIILQSMVSDKGELNLALNPSSEVDLTEYGQNGQWDLLTAVIEEKDETHRAAVRVTLTMKRRPTFYVLNIILPVLFLSLMGALVFALPAESGEKVSLAITLLLAYVVFLTILSESMPQTSLQLSLLSLYLTVLVALSTLAVVTSVAVLRIFHKDPNIPVPSILEKIILFNCKTKSRCITVAPVGDEMSPRDKSMIIKLDEVKVITWMDVSRTMDSFFFWAYMFITVVSTVVILLLMMQVR